MDAASLKAAMLKQREQRVQLAEGRAVFIRRPAEAKMGPLLNVDGDKLMWQVGIEDVKAAVVGWEGFTEATLLGEAVGSSDPVPFDKELFATYIDDHIDESSVIGKAVLDAVASYVAKRGASEKNSDSGSTSSPTSQPA